jgi:hypothetical protein
VVSASSQNKHSAHFYTSGLENQSFGIWVGFCYLTVNGKAFCVLHFEVSRSVKSVQREFRAQFRTAGSAKPFPAATLSWKLTPWPRSKHEKRTAGSA